MADADFYRRQADHYAAKAEAVERLEALHTCEPGDVIRFGRSVSSGRVLTYVGILVRVEESISTVTKSVLRTGDYWYLSGTGVPAMSTRALIEWLSDRDVDTVFKVDGESAWKQVTK